MTAAVVLASTLGCSPARRAAPAPNSAKPFCSVPAPAALKQAQTTETTTAAPGEDVFPTAIGPGGDGYAAAEGQSAAHMNTLAWIDAAGRRRAVVSLTPPYQGFGGMDFDGRWLIYMADQSLDLSGAWDLYTWDRSAAGPPRRIAGDDGSEPGSPIEWPHVQGGKATWVQGLKDGTRQVHLYDLASGSDKVVATGHVGASFFAGDLLVWTRATVVDGPIQLAAASAATGSPASLPSGPAQAHTAPAAVASDGTTWAWAAPDYRTLYAWRPGMADAETVHVADPTDSVDQLGVSGDIITWTGSHATYAANLRTRSFTQITPQYGAALTKSDTVMVSYPDGDPKSPNMTYRTYRLRSGDLAGLDACPA